MSKYVCMLHIHVISFNHTNISCFPHIIAVPFSARVCQGRTVGLVRYPTTLAPDSGLVYIHTDCADNAHRISSTLSVTCSFRGHWGGAVPECQCDSGYQIAVAHGRQVCQGK